MNTNPNAKRILCFGDSLTWGFEPGSSHQRFASDKRWTGVLQNTLGDNFEVIEEGLNSRGIENGDPRPWKKGRRALDYIIPCLDTHDPIDYVIVLLGTNELQYEMNQTPEDIKKSMGKLLEVIANRKSQMRKVKPKIILLAPPLVNDSSVYASKDDRYKLASEKSEKLGKKFEELAKELRIEFLNLSKFTETGIDGVHINEESHKIVGENIAKLIK